MVSRKILTALLLLFFVSIVTFAVVTGGCLLATAMDDDVLASALKGVALASLALWGITTILLVAALGINAIAPASEERNEAPGAETPYDEEQ